MRQVRYSHLPLSILNFEIEGIIMASYIERR